MSVPKALKHLAKADPIMKRLIPHAGEIVLDHKEDYFEVLVNSIISQLISSKAADTVSARLSAYCNDLIDPQLLAQIDTETYRSFGIGPQKSGYIRSLAESFRDRPEDFVDLNSLTDAEVVKRLTGIKGVGKWTAEMFLIFGLGRLDVFAPDDFGLRNAIIRHYAMEDPSRKELVAHAASWAPYRSVASIVLWRSLSIPQ